jgi:hypothetical protein
MLRLRSPGPEATGERDRPTGQETVFRPRLRGRCLSPDQISHVSGTVGRSWASAVAPVKTAPVSPPKPGPTFLTIRWEQPDEKGGVVIVESTLCLDHRREIALKYSSTQGCGRLGDSCDACEGRQPRRSH